MTGAIFDGICRAIADGFGLPVYTERVKQGLDGPCFVVRLESSVTELFFGKRYLMKNRFKITYLDPSADEEQNCLDAAEKLCDVLEVIDYGDGTVRGSDIKCAAKENYMEMWVSYDLFVWKYDGGEEDTGLMEDISIDESGIK